MLKNLGMVQACCHTPRFRSNAFRRLGGRSLLEWVIRRVTDSMRLDGVIVVACSREDCCALGRLVPSDVPVFFGEGDDTLARFCRALEQYPAEGVVRVRGDNLFVDPGLIDRLVTTAESHPDCDYVSYCSRDGRPAILSPVSVYAEWFRAGAQGGEPPGPQPAPARAGDSLHLFASREVQPAAHSGARGDRPGRRAADGGHRGGLGPRRGDLRGVGAGAAGLAADCPAAGPPAGHAAADGGAQPGA